MSTKKKTIMIKRYASRRLYNSNISEYVTLSEIADLIREGHDIQIVDKKSNEDLTRQYLLQIISDQEANGEKAFPVNILMEVIRAYKDQTQTLMPDFLSRSYEIFKEQQSLYLKEQKALLEKASSAASPAPSSSDLLTSWHGKMSEWLGQGLTGNIAAGLVTNPISPSVTAEAMSAWQKQQSQFFEKAMGHLTPQSKASKTEAPSSTEKDDEIAQMKAQLAALNKKLNEL